MGSLLQYCRFGPLVQIHGLGKLTVASLSNPYIFFHWPAIFYLWESQRLLRPSRCPFLRGFHGRVSWLFLSPFNVVCEILQSFPIF